MKGGAESPLNAHSIGTGENDLIRRCEIGVVPRTPVPPPPREPAIAAAFSGGGFRATLTALGVLRFLADAGLLAQVRYASSVSGGSVANGLFACSYEDLQAKNFSADTLDERVIRPFVERISSDSLTIALVASIWRTLGPATRTDLLADKFDAWFFAGRSLESLTSECRFIFNAANVTTGVRFGFERDAMGDWVMGEVATAGTQMRVAHATAASAAVPGAFAPFSVRSVEFPCANGRTAKLLDGGAYDNSGLEGIDHLRDALLVGVNAGGLFRTGAYKGVPIVRDLQRANSLLYRQSTATRRREMVERFQAWERAQRAGKEPPSFARRGVLFGLATEFSAAPEWVTSRNEHREWTNKLANYKTSFARFPIEICHRLLYRGWWLAGAALTTYHRELLPDELPHRSPHE